jgi:hypothetical protein
MRRRRYALYRLARNTAEWTALALLVAVAAAVPVGAVMGIL